MSNTRPDQPVPLTNLHVHVAPNFSAFVDVDDVVAEALAEGVRAIGISSFFDASVYARFDEACRGAGIVPLFGLEFVTLDTDLAAAGVKVNDPANPGRIYFCGKGIQPFKAVDEAAAATYRAIRQGNDERATAMVSAVNGHFAAVGVAADVSADAVALAVAERAGVPTEWVSLQERHIAQAFGDAIAALPASEQADALARVLGRASTSDLADSVAIQGELRSALLKSGTVGFVPEVPLSFDAVYAYVLAAGGIPTYPILADGAPTISEFEAPPAELAERLLARGVHAAELIPNRNASAVVDEYVSALNAAGIIVMGGTEHNTSDRIPLDPACADGPLSELARNAFYTAACVVAAHQALVADGQPGYVDAAGALVGDAEHVAALVALGDSLINA